MNAFTLGVTIVVVAGTAWGVALFGIICIGGWYASTHTIGENDRVVRRLTHLLWLLTFGLTDPVKPEAEEEEKSYVGERGWNPAAHSARHVIDVIINE